MQAAIEERVNQPMAGGTGGFVAGMVIGGLAAAGTMLLLAPQPGKDTRAELRVRGTRLRERTAKTLGVRIADARAKAIEVSGTARRRLAEMRTRGKAAVAQEAAGLTAGHDQFALA